MRSAHITIYRDSTQYAIIYRILLLNDYLDITVFDSITIPRFLLSPNAVYHRLGHC